MVSGYKT
jgi:hypothetical protein